MKFEELYRKTFSQVHPSGSVRWEEIETMAHMAKKRPPVRRTLLIAAVVCLLAALSAAAVATDFFGLRRALLPEQGKVDVVDGNGVVVPGEVEYKDFVSLSGFVDTAETRALAEWREFLDGYDQDGAIISAVGNDPTGFEEEYGLYTVYTQEMADKLDEIVSKYGLRLHTALEVVLPTVWPEAAGASFMGPNNTAYSGYIYEDGTFRYDGEAYLEDYGTIEYQFSRSVRGSFNDVSLNVGDLSQFQEWGHRAPDGTMLTLGLGPLDRSLILADLGESFVLVNVLTGETGDDIFSSGPIGRTELEELADSFDYMVLAQVRRPDLDAVREAGDRYMAELESGQTGSAGEEDPLYGQTGIEIAVAREFIQLLAERIEDGQEQDVAGMIGYPAQVTTLSGTYTVSTPEELLEHYGETIGESARTLAADLSWDPQPFAGGSGLVSAADGTVWFGLVEDGVIRIFTLQTDQWSIRPAGDIADGVAAASAREDRAFLLELAEMLEEVRREDIADLFVYPVLVETVDGTFQANLPGELLEYYNDTIGQSAPALAAELRADEGPYADGAALSSAGDGAVWFGLREGGRRIFTLQTDQWSIRPAE